MWEKIKSFFALVGVFFLGLFCGKLLDHRRAAERDTGTDADNKSGSGKDKEREQRIEDASGRIDAIIAEVRRTKTDIDND